MQKMLSYIRRACDDYNMIEDGDRIAVGVSGGKDSVMLLAALSAMRRFYPKKYELVAIILDPQFNGVQTDYSKIEELCKSLEIPLVIKRTQIGQIIFEERREKSPCSLCARMRRGALHDAAIEAGCKKLALGHHYNDVVETFLMNLFSEGRVGCFSPLTYLSRKDIYMIRPLIYAPENEIEAAVKRLSLPIIKSACPADGNTLRQTVKERLAEEEKNSPSVTEKVFGALVRSGIDGWGKAN
ncbi:MAG: tRNA 2-thiocytidine(32) synthetase TtcA [Ruminococcaceae bacterium]|nr:tRNA 2-thiocytidine(32) synthetase TtcA [Oscillospiraceae bacterium]